MPKRFSFALNKLHLWNMTQFDRLIYLDADNIAINHKILDDLFLCGHFCVVYMNPCHFHTGLVVVKPNATIFLELLGNLAKTGSYDGADQGFLSEYFSEGCAVAPLFNPNRGQSNAPHNVLHIAYNMHALYYYVRGDIDIYRCGPSGDSEDELPVATLGYPVPPLIKPWYFWTPIMGHSDHWHAIRNTLDEPDIYMQFFLRLVAVILFYVGISTYVLPPFLQGDHCPLRLRRALLRMGPTAAGILVGTVSFVITAEVCISFVPFILRPWMGMTLYTVTHILVLTLLARISSNVCFAVTSSPSSHPVPLQLSTNSAAALILLFTTKLWRPLFVVFMGYGLQTVIVCFVLACAAVVSTQLYLFVRVSRSSPIFSGFA